MTLKAIMVDVDGVLVVHPDRRGWSCNLEDELGLSVRELQTEFFQSHWDDIIHGRAAMRDRLEPVLAVIAPNLTYDDFVTYWFTQDSHVDDSLFTELHVLRTGGLEIHLATVQEHERARYLWEDLDFKSAFDAMHYAADLGVSKPSWAFFHAIEQRTGFTSSELFFIDDKLVNVEAARTCGWSACHWTRETPLSALIAPYL